MYLEYNRTWTERDSESGKEKIPIHWNIFFSLFPILTSTPFLILQSFSIPFNRPWSPLYKYTLFSLYLLSLILLRVMQMASAWRAPIGWSSSRSRSGSTTTWTICWSVSWTRSAWRTAATCRRIGVETEPARVAATGTSRGVWFERAWRPDRCWRGCSAKRTASSRTARTFTSSKDGPIDSFFFSLPPLSLFSFFFSSSFLICGRTWGRRV